MICTERAAHRLREPGPNLGPPGASGPGLPRARLGRFRLVNPDRGSCLAVLSGRLMALALEGGTWEVVVLAGGCHYSPGRAFRRDDLVDWAASHHPRAGLDGWVWRTYGPWGVAELKDPPGAAELAALAEGVASGPGPGDEPPIDALAILDRFEIWACDKGSGRPLALLATAPSYFEAEAIGFSPAPTGRLIDRYDYLGETWRFDERPGLAPAARAFQTKVNARIQATCQTGLFPFRRRIFERLPGGSAIEHDRGHRRDIPPCELPAGLLAEPLESERLALVQRRLGEIN